MYDDEEQHPIIEADYAKHHPRKCARYQLDALARRLQERLGRNTRMVPSRVLRKRYKMDSNAIRDYCAHHGILNEVHVEMTENQDGDESAHLVLYIDEIGFSEAMQANPPVDVPPPGWLPLTEIAARWRKDGLYTDVVALRTFCRHQAVQDAQCAKRALIQTENGQHRIGWCADPEKLLRLWEKDLTATK